MTLRPSISLTSFSPLVSSFWYLREIFPTGFSRCRLYIHTRTDTYIHISAHSGKKPFLLYKAVAGFNKANAQLTEGVQRVCVYYLQIIQERNSELERSLQSSSGKVTMEDINSGKPFLIGKQKRLAFLDMLLVTAKSGADLSLDGIQEEVDTFMFEVSLLDFFIYLLLSLCF